MAPRGDHQHHLVKVGLEGFALIDECLGRPRRARRLPSPQGTQTSVCQYHGPQVVTVKVGPMNSNEKVQHYDAAAAVPYIYQGKEAVVDSTEAAKLYGGLQTISYYRKEKSYN
ncbi:hypothetical protein CFOL_v3_07679 [Cephalotus follicularis]|uniref:Uncharacterized protein n=1 Tax=Cephalotus follicularis TaxID=3775 RepID=A0A1Q3B7Z2_CEPFO|nr:hypothetical protein CFOL_v3_07679 [Cephalotus follicularis]